MAIESQPELTCILHVEDADRGRVVKKIDDNWWTKITETVAALKKWLKQTKYDELLINSENHYRTFGYHTSCYKNFTADHRALSSNSSSTEEFGCKQTRSESRSQRGSSSGVLVAKCIFCNCIKHNNLKVVTSLDLSAEIKIRMAEWELDNEDLLVKIGSYVHGSGSDFTALEVKYHKACYWTYLNKVRLSSANKNSQLKEEASAAFLKHVDKLCVKQNIPILVSSLLKT